MAVLRGCRVYTRLFLAAAVRLARMELAGLVALPIQTVVPLAAAAAAVRAVEVREVALPVTLVQAAVGERISPHPSPGALVVRQAWQDHREAAT